MTRIWLLYMTRIATHPALKTLKSTIEKVLCTEIVMYFDRTLHFKVLKSNGTFKRLSIVLIITIHVRNKFMDHDNARQIFFTCAFLSFDLFPQSSSIYYQRYESPLINVCQAYLTCRVCVQGYGRYYISFINLF